MDQTTKKPLTGIRVVEMGSLLAGPFAARLLAEFGAEVIKVEPPGTGDPLRKWRKLHDGTSLWWYVQSRNKKSVTVNLKDSRGQELVHRLLAEADILVENFRPGTLEKWNLGWEDLHVLHPGLIMVRVSGYGQSGPYRDRTGFGSIGEAMGGIRYLTGDPDRPPVRAGISLGDSLAGIYGALGVMMALRHRDRTGRGQMVDVALYEAVFSLMESMLPEYDRYGVVRERTGSVLPGIAPSNTYRCKDGKYVVIGGNGDSIFKRLMRVIGREDLAADPELEQNDGRVKRADELDEAIGAWSGRRELDDVLEALERAQVPAGKIYSIEDIARDPHYLAREMIREERLPDGSPLKLPGIVPRLSETPGGTDSLGPALGEHNERVFSELGLSPEEQLRLAEAGVIGCQGT